MEKNKLIILGAGKGFFEVNELIKAINKEHFKYEIIGILDDDTDKHGKCLEGIEVLGSLSMIEKFKKDSEIGFVYCIGSRYTKNIRCEVLKKLKVPVERFVTLIHPRAEVATTAKIGAGCIIHAGTVICSYAELSNFVVIAFNSFIGLYAKIGKYTLISSHAAILNYAEIGRMVFVGINSTITDKVKISDRSVVGVASVVTRNTKCGELVIGNPSRSLGSADFWIKAEQQKKE